MQDTKKYIDILKGMKPKFLMDSINELTGEFPNNYFRIERVKTKTKLNEFHAEVFRKIHAIHNEFSCFKDIQPQEVADLYFDKELLVEIFGYWRHDTDVSELVVLFFMH